MYYEIIAGLAALKLLDTATTPAAIQGIKVAHPKPPYDKNGKTNFRWTNNRIGVYVIRENGRIVYVGGSAHNLYRTLYRHFQVWKHPYQNVITYQNKLQNYKYTVEVFLTNTAKQAAKIEAFKIQKHNPRDNNYKQYTIQYDNDKIKQQLDEAEEYPF